MDFINEVDVAGRQADEQACYVARSFERGRRGDPDVDAHLLGDDEAERRLAQAWRTVEEQMVERLVAVLGRIDRDLQTRLETFLARVVRKALRPQGCLDDVLCDGR